MDIKEDIPSAASNESMLQMIQGDVQIMDQSILEEQDKVLEEYASDAGGKLDKIIRTEEREWRQKKRNLIIIVMARLERNISELLKWNIIRMVEGRIFLNETVWGKIK